jgi:hypothetical protein
MMAKTKTAGAGMSASLKPKLTKQKKTKVARVRHFGIPGLGRIAFSRDPCEADLFRKHFLSTNLSAIVRNPYGELVEERNLGSGLITNLGVIALAYDFGVPAPAKTVNAVNLFKLLKWHQWGKGTTAAKESDWKLETQEEIETEAFKGKEATSTVTWGPKWSERRWVSTATLVAKNAGPVAITEWGLFGDQEPKGTEKTGAAVAPSATTFAVEAGSLTASSVEVRGNVNKVIWIKETEEPLGLVTSNTTGVVTVGGFIKAGTEITGVAKESSKYNFYPLMWDRRVFSPINVEKGNSIEFPYSLEFKLGG